MSITPNAHFRKLRQVLNQYVCASIHMTHTEWASRVTSTETEDIHNIINVLSAVGSI